MLNRVIIQTNKATGEIKAYSSISVFVNSNPEYKSKYNHFQYVIGRKGLAFENKFIRLERIMLISPKPKQI